MKYAKLIADECLNDIDIDKTDKKSMKAHNDAVLQFIK